MNLFSLHSIITGRVQGVGFRYFTDEKARFFGITGYVKNLSNGDVEVYAEGEQQDVAEFFTQVKKGPALGRIIDAGAEWNKIVEKKYKDFSITY